LVRVCAAGRHRFRRRGATASAVCILIVTGFLAAIVAGGLTALLILAGATSNHKKPPEAKAIAKPEHPEINATGRVVKVPVAQNGGAEL
jgi:hypothetical protein